MYLFALCPADPLAGCPIYARGQGCRVDLYGGRYLGGAGSCAVCAAAGQVILHGGLYAVKGDSADHLTAVRKKVHVGMAVLMAVVIFVIGLLNNTSVINAVYVLASYTYGPILGMFAFGIFMKKKVRDRYVPLAAIVAPVLCYILQTNSEAWFNGYKFSYELLIFNALFTFIGLCLLIKKEEK